jgi:hypothetical protein
MIVEVVEARSTRPSERIVVARTAKQCERTEDEAMTHVAVTHVFPIGIAMPMAHVFPISLGNVRRFSF